MVAEIDDDHEHSGMGMTSRHRQPFRNPVSPAMRLDEAWYAVPMTSRTAVRPDAATRLFRNTVHVFVGSAPVWRWTSREQIHRVGRSTRLDDECATYVLMRRLGEEHRPAARRALDWLGRYLDPTAAFDPDPTGVRDPPAFKLDWVATFRGAAAAEQVLLGRTGAARVGQVPQPLEA